MAPFLKLAHSFHYMYTPSFLIELEFSTFAPFGWMAGWLVALMLLDGMVAWLSKVPYVRQ